MQNIDGPPKSNSVDGSIGVAVVILDDLKNACAAKAFKRFGGHMFAAEFGLKEGEADFVSRVFGKIPQVSARRSHPFQGLAPRRLSHQANISIPVIAGQRGKGAVGASWTSMGGRQESCQLPVVSCQ